MSEQRERIVDALTRAAELMNELEDLGAHVTLKWDSVTTDFGYVLRGPGARWAPRLKLGEAPLVLEPDDLNA